MTWAEFCIRQHAYRRMDKAEWYKVREIAYAAIVGSHYDPNKIPKTQEDFLPLNEKKGVTDSMKDKIRQAQERFFKEQAKKK